MELFDTDSLQIAREKLWEQSKNKIKKTKMVSLIEATNCILAADFYAPDDIPAFARSTMDGYAICAKDSFGASSNNPLFFEVIDHVAIDQKTNKIIGANQAVQVQTGSCIPQGANAVVMVEMTEEFSNDKLMVYQAVSVGENINQKGEDMQKGQCLLEKGTKLDGTSIGILASFGIEQVEVYEPLTMTIISTGDELVDLQEVCSGSQIRDINSYSIMSCALKHGFQIIHRCLIKDEKAELKKEVENACEISDIVILSGGSSKGEKDFSKKVMMEVTQNVLTHGIAIKPGKPTIIAYDKQNQSLVVGLPGHPLAALLMFQLIVLDWYQRFFQQKKRLPRYAQIQQNVSSNQGRETCLLVQLHAEETGFSAIPIHTKSGNISSRMKADGFTLIPRDKEGLKKGEWIVVEELA